MAFNYAPFAGLASSLIGSFGTEVTLSRNDEPIAVTSGVFSNRKVYQRSANGHVEVLAVKVLVIPAVDLDSPPLPLDTLAVGTGTYQVQAVKEIKPADTVISYELTVEGE